VTSWDAARQLLDHLDTPQKHRKRPDLTGKCLKQEVVPGLFQSSQATVLELWGTPGHSWDCLCTLRLS